jgi:hypothetical protein
MTADDILRMAREADPFGDHGRLVSLAELTPRTLERFAALVAAAEREECAKVCEYRAMALDYSGNQYVRDHAALDCARSIRARENKS